MTKCNALPECVSIYYHRGEQKECGSIRKCNKLSKRIELLSISHASPTFIQIVRALKEGARKKQKNTQTKLRKRAKVNEILVL